MSIYLDYQATTPLAPEVRAAMLPWLGCDNGFANPHSPHKMGRAAAATVEVAREAVAALLPKGGRVYFTSGATEALNWAIKGSGAQAIALPDTEHAAVRDTALWRGDCGYGVTLMPVRRDGLLDLAEIPAGQGLVAVMHVNNEIGVIQPIAEIAARARANGALMLCDAVQSYGRIAIPEGPDLIAISAHKIYGPKGVGALWVRDGVTLEPLLHGGGQEGGIRSGTLSPALCAGFGAAAKVARERFETDAGHVAYLWNNALSEIPETWKINGSITKRYKGNLNIHINQIDASRLISEVRGVAFSAGSACASGSGRSSHVLRALGLTEAEARSSIRLGFGRYTTTQQLHTALQMIKTAVAEQEIG
ncbi:MAG: cysteine desulfurase family protein [Pseudomonadota bacterium]